MSTSALPKLFAWVVPLMGGDFAVRQWHHAFMCEGERRLAAEAA